MSTTERPTDQTLEELLAERNRLWDELQQARADERELEHWRSRAQEMESTVWWRATVLWRRLREDPVGFARVVVRRLRELRSA